jgi:hypothetical protein
MEALGPMRIQIRTLLGSHVRLIVQSGQPARAEGLSLAGAAVILYEVSIQFQTASAAS